jgi:hypothetical protein
MILVAVMATIDLLSNLTPSSAGYGFDPQEVQVGDTRELRVTFDNIPVPIDESKPWVIVLGEGTLDGRRFTAGGTAGEVRIEVTLANGLMVVPTLRVVIELTKLPDPPPGGGTEGAALIAFAERWIGAPYCLGHAIPGPNTQPPNRFATRIHTGTGTGCINNLCTINNRGLIAFDCGAFTLFVYSEVLGLNIGGRRVRNQFDFILNGGGQFVPINELQPGDLVFFNAPGPPQTSSGRFWTDNEHLRRLNVVNNPGGGTYYLDHIELFHSSGRQIGAGSPVNIRNLSSRRFVGGRLNIPNRGVQNFQSSTICGDECVILDCNENETKNGLTPTLQKYSNLGQQIEMYHESRRKVFKIFDRLIFHERKIVLRIDFVNAILNMY